MVPFSKSAVLDLIYLLKLHFNLIFQLNYSWSAFLNQNFRVLFDIVFFFFFLFFDQIGVDLAGPKLLSNTKLVAKLLSVPLKFNGSKCR
jgi:hypothetical protein